jgi:hypothetical protein
MAIKYIHPLTNEAVQRETWRWVALYNDGTTLEQFAVEDRGAVFHQSPEIDTSKLQSLELVHDIYPKLTIDFPAGAEVVFFYRRTTAQDILHGVTPAEDTITRTRKYKRTFIGFRKGTDYWLVSVDDYNNVIFTSDKNMFKEEY